MSAIETSSMRPKNETPVVDPGVEAAEVLQRALGDAGDISLVTDLGPDGHRLAPGRADLLGEFLQRAVVTRREHERRAALGGHPRRHEPMPLEAPVMTTTRFSRLGRGRAMARPLPSPRAPGYG